MTLPDLVQTLAGLKLEHRELEARISMIEQEIFRQAVEELAIVPTPKLNRTSQFRCAGKIVELLVSSFGSRAVQILEVDSLPSVPT
jgi:hypothetical protein